MSMENAVIAIFGLMLLCSGFAGGAFLTLACYLADRVKCLHDKKQRK